MPPRRTRQVVPADLPAEDAPAISAVAEVTELPEAFAAPSPRKRAARQLQAATADSKTRLPEGKRAVETRKGELKAPLKGRYFRLSGEIGLMPLMEWAAAADDGIDVGSSQALISFFRILQDLVHSGDWASFRKYARDERCTDEELLAFQSAAMEALAARPTREPAAS